MCKFRVYIGHIFVYCNMITTAVLAKSSVMSHNYHIVFGVWEQLRSSLSATLKLIIRDYCLYSQCCICNLVDLLDQQDQQILLIFWLIDWFQIWAPKQHCTKSFSLQTLKTTIQLSIFVNTFLQFLL